MKSCAHVIGQLVVDVAFLLLISVATAQHLTVASEWHF